jgi:glycosyltransferase involved in cell wall biosynthesis
MRILMCCADWGVPLGGNGGSSVHLRSMAKALSGLGHEVRLLVSNPGGPVKTALPVDSVPFRRLWPGLLALSERGRHLMSFVPYRVPGLVPEQGHTVSPRPAPQPPDQSELSWRLRFCYQDLPKTLDTFEELFVHPRFFGRAVTQAMAGFKPHAVYERYALGQTGAAWAVRAAGGDGPVHLLEVNASLAFERTRQGDFKGFWSWWGRRMESRLWRIAKRVFCVSGRLRDLAIAAGADPGRVRVVPNGVDVEAFTPDRPRGALRELLGASRGELLIGWLGSLSPGRGAEEFLRVLALALPQAGRVRGVVIGDGPLAGQCRALAKEVGLAGRVDFLGSVPHERVPDILVDLDVAVASYPDQEGFYFSPLKVAEYLACGLAVVAGRTGQVMDMIVDGVNGRLVEPGDLAAWSKAVVGLCRDRAMRESLGMTARCMALLGPTWENNARQVEREILACRREKEGAQA